MLACQYLLIELVSPLVSRHLVINQTTNETLTWWWHVYQPSWQSVHGSHSCRYTLSTCWGDFGERRWEWITSQGSICVQTLCQGPPSENWYPCCYTSFTAEHLVSDALIVGGWQTSECSFNTGLHKTKNTHSPRSSGPVKQVQIVTWCLHWAQALPTIKWRTSDSGGLSANQ